MSLIPAQLIASTGIPVLVLASSHSGLVLAVTGEVLGAEVFGKRGSADTATGKDGEQLLEFPFELCL